MIRSLIIIFNLILALFIKLLADDPTAVVKVPSSVKAGESFVAEITVKPNGETKFMRYSLLLPNGWNAEEVNSDGGTFKFSKQSASVQWLSVAGRTELKISMRITVAADASGDVSLTNKLSHPVDNQAKNIDLDPVVISIVPATASTTYNATHNVPDSTAKPLAEVTIERVVPTDAVTNGEFVVSITIHKEDMTSFGKIEDTLPEGFTAKLLKSDGADFKFENGVARFGWYAGMPKKSTLNVQYKVVVSPDMNGNQPISGHFSYVENEKGKVISVPTSLVFIQQKQVVVQNTTTNTDNAANSGNSTSPTNSTNTTDNTANNTNNSTAKEDKTASNNSDNSTNNNSTSNSTTQTASNTSSTSNTNSNSNSDNTTTTEANPLAKSASGIVFRVQIAAMLRALPLSYFKNTFNISDAINAEQDNGLNKYLTGSFSTYQEARDHRNAMRNKGVADAFVTAFNAGKRITVQEALMITSQKWVL